MNTAYTLIVRHCHNQLVARGWPASMEISANLSYRQGDGVAFYGRLDTHALLALLPVLAVRGVITEAVAGELSTVISNSDFSMSLCRTSLSNRYSHAGTISLEYDDCPEAMTEGHIDLLFRALRTEINAACGSVAADGYRIIEAISPSLRPTLLERRTRHFVVSVIETELNDDACAGWDHEIQDSYLDAILNKNATLCTLEISVRCSDIGRVMGRTWVSDVLRMPTEPVRSWFERDWMRDALDEAREEIACMLMALQSFRTAA